MTKKVKRKLKAKKRPAQPMPTETKSSPEIPEMLFCRLCDSYSEHLDGICQTCGSSVLGNQQ